MNVKQSEAYQPFESWELKVENYVDTILRRNTRGSPVTGSQHLKNDFLLISHMHQIIFCFDLNGNKYHFPIDSRLFISLDIRVTHANLFT